MRRRLHGVLVGALGLALGAGALLTGAGTASAATTVKTAASGTVTLTARGNSVTDASPFSQVSVSKACPADYQDSLTVSLVVPDGRESILVSNLTTGAPYSAAPITAPVPAASGNGTVIRSIATAFAVTHVPLADGTYPIHVTCANADKADFPEHPTSTGFISVTGSTWQVSGLPAPAATKIRLTPSPARHVQVGQPFTLTATVTRGVPGVVKFAADNGINPIGDPVPVVNGSASVQPPANTVPSVRNYIAIFVPADQLGHAQAYGTLDYSFVQAPSITLTDAAGNALGADPQLTAGQQITVSATGFKPSAGEKVDVAATNVYSILPALFPSTTSDAAGSVTNYTLTVPRFISDGSHQLVLLGESSLIYITFDFTTK
ncbi:hypothetical protein ACFO3J_15000 [Streptomyces polygonati]|uniref:Uncharacterized protein n=1 Tax=Streptomyces polygonati TaxID=1617087 RepID=A0ABV8HPJ7_9ACTN